MGSPWRALAATSENLAMHAAATGSFASGDGDHHVECRACGYANDEAVIGRAALEAGERPMTGGLPRLP